MTDKIIASLPQKSTPERARIRANCDNWLATGTPQQQSNARKVLDALDTLTQSDAASLYDRLSGMTVAARVVAAFRKHPPSDTETRVIQTLLNNPASTSSTLSAAMGWGGQSWHQHFGTMCRNREASLWPADPSQTRDAHFYSGILADIDPNGNRFTMKPEVAGAFVELGFLVRSGGVEDAV